MGDGNYNIHLSCGHWVDGFDECIKVEFEEFIVDRGDMEHGGGMGKVYTSICKKCLATYRKFPKFKVVKQYTNPKDIEG